MVSCEGLDNRNQMLHVLAQAPAEVLEHLAADQPLFKRILAWLEVSQGHSGVNVMQSAWDGSRSHPGLVAVRPSLHLLVQLCWACVACN
jgi:hypothetical protein